MSQKIKPVEINITKFISQNKPLTLKQIQTIQKTVVNNMINLGKSSSEIYDFFKKSNELKKYSKSQSVRPATAKKIRSLLNVGDVGKVNGKNVLVIKKTPKTSLSKFGGEKTFDNRILSRLKRAGLISKSSENLIEQRKSRKTNINKWKVSIKDKSRIQEILEILDSFSNPEKYFPDIQRICHDYLGIWLESYEEYVEFRKSLI